MRSVRYDVRYQIATYSGIVTYSGGVEVDADPNADTDHVIAISGGVEVDADPNADTDHVIAIAKAQLLRRYGPMPSGPIYESWRVVK